jgi:hypothetical protein
LLRTDVGAPETAAPADDYYYRGGPYYYVDDADQE